MHFIVVSVDEVTSQVFPSTVTEIADEVVVKPDPLIVSCCPAGAPLFGVKLYIAGKTAK